MQSNSKLTRFILLSPFALLLFFVIPGTLILSRTLHFPLPIPITTGVILANNILLLGCLLLRFLRYLSGLRRTRRYETDTPAAAASLELPQDAGTVRGKLAAAGFRFEADGSYGEKRDIGYLGTTLIYGGLFFMLFVGTWENLRQFSGTIIKGPGAALDLARPDKYYNLITGPLSSPAGFPLMKVTQQTFPNSTYPLGASEIKLYGRDGTFAGGAFLDASKDPYRFGQYDIYLASLLADFALTIKTKGSQENNVFDEAVKVRPLYDKKIGDYTLYGTFTTPLGDDGDALYDPTHNVFKIRLTHKGVNLFSTEYKYQAYREKAEGGYVISVLGMGHWSEIHVVRRRHMSLIIAGAVIAGLGLLLRLLFRAQRVWLEKTASGCRLRYVGGAARGGLE